MMTRPILLTMPNLHTLPSEVRLSDFSKLGPLSNINRKGLLNVIAGGPRKSQNVSRETEEDTCAS